MQELFHFDTAPENSPQLLYIITSYLAGDYFQAPAAPMVTQQSSLIILPEREYSS